MVAASSSASTSAPHQLTFKSTFLPASFGNSIACYRAADLHSSGATNGSEKAGAGGKGKKTASSGKQAQSPIKFAEFEVLRRKAEIVSPDDQFTTETYTVYASLQDVAAGFERGELLEDDAADEYDNTINAISLRQRDRIPQAGQIAYYSRFAQLYKDSLSRYLVQISSQNEIDTDELSLISSLRDVMHLAQVVYIPQDGRGDGIVSEELVDFLDTTSPWPTAERQEALTTLAAPFEKPDFWGFIYTSIMRGHLSLASTVLKTLLSHPSAVLQRLTQACLDLLSSLPRSNSPLYAYESTFLSALRAWRNKLTALLARLDMDMDEFQEEIEAQEQEDGTENEDESMEACADERFEWQAGFGALLKILSGDVAAIVDASEDGWKSALTAWCLLVRPGLKRDDLPSTIQTITSSLPADQTLFKEAISVALISGDVPKVLRLASETDTWLSAHLCDLFSKLGLLEDPFGESTPGGEMEIGFRDHFILQYTDILLSDPGLWRIVVDYLASLDNVDIGRGRMRELLLSLGSTARVGDSEEDMKGGMDGKAEIAGGEDDKAAAATGDEAHLKSKKQTRIEDVLEACAQYGLEDVTRSLCLSAAESLIAQRKYGQAVAYCISANDSGRINKIADLILDEYVRSGVSALSFIDDIPTSLLQPANFSLHDIHKADMEEDEYVKQERQHAVVLAAGTRLAFLARYRDFHALYASGERREAGELLVLLMSSNAAPKRFWCIMLIDAVTLLNDSNILINEQDTLELMRCLSEIVQPVQQTGRDLYGYLACLSKLAGSNTSSQAQAGGKKSTTIAEEQERQSVQAGLGQLEVVRYALVQNLGRCFMHQV